MRPATIYLAVTLCIVIFAVAMIESYDNPNNGAQRWSWGRIRSTRSKGGSKFNSGQSYQQSSGGRKKKGSGSNSSSGNSSPQRPQTSGYQRLPQQKPEPRFQIPDSTKCEGKCRERFGGPNSCKRCCVGAKFSYGGKCDYTYEKTKCICNIEKAY